MAVKDFGLDWSKWYIYEHKGKWFVCPGEGCGYGDADNSVFTRDTFAEAHAAYLDAVTCEAQTPFPTYTEPRCTRTKGHQGGHWFKGRNGLTDMEQMPK